MAGLGEDNELSLDMIGNLSEEEINEFNNKNSEEEITEEDTLFPISAEDSVEDKGEIIPEGVGDGSQEENEDETLLNQNGDSPNFYASIASALKKDGILTLDDSEFKTVENADDLAMLFTKMKDKLVTDALDDYQKRTKEALDSGVQPSVIKQHEKVIGYLNSIKVEDLEAETQEAEDLRGNILMQDYLNAGIPQDKAERLVNASFDAGTDVEDAIKALESNKNHFNTSYQKVIKEAQNELNSKKESEKELSKKIEDKFLKTEEPIKGVKLTEKERKNILTQYTKFVDKDTNGNPLNAIQKYANDNPVDYQYNINLLFHLTNGFTDLGTIVSKEVNRNKKSALSEIELALRNSNKGFGSGLDLGNDNDPESFSGVNVLLD